MATPPVTSVASAPKKRGRGRPRKTKKDSHKSGRSSELPSANDIGGRSRSPIKSPGSHNNAVANHSTSASPLPFSENTSALNCKCSLESEQNNWKKGENAPLGICIRNLPVQATATSLRDELFRRFKKLGRVRMVKIINEKTERYAVVCFKRTEDAHRALEIAKGKSLHGSKIEVTPHEGLLAVHNRHVRPKSIKIELDEFHPKATRTLFIGNLEKDITTEELRKHFDKFGEIMEIDIIKQDLSSYAFIQYSDITSAVEAVTKMKQKKLGANQIKVTFGKSVPTNCIWIDGIMKGISNKFLARHFSRFGVVEYATIDQEKGDALIFYESVDMAEMALSKMRGRIFFGKKLQVDFASRESQITFFNKLEKSTQMNSGDKTQIGGNTR